MTLGAAPRRGRSSPSPTLAAPAPPAASLRDRKKDEVRGALAEAALALAKESGWEAVTAEAIATRAGVSRRTFFRYFPTKEAVVLARRAEQLARFREALAEVRPRESPAAAVRRACAALAEEYQAERRRILGEHALFRGSAALAGADLDLDRAFETAIAEAALARARSADGRRARLYAAAVVGVLRVSIEEWAAAKGKADLAALGAEALELVEPLAPR